MAMRAEKVPRYDLPATGDWKLATGDRNGQLVLQAASHPRSNAEHIHRNAEQVCRNEPQLPGPQSDHADDRAIHARNRKPGPALAPDQNRRKNRKTARQII
jgi:hypothetical protein